MSWKKKSIGLLGLFLILAVIFFVQKDDIRSRSLIVIVDMEPDDRIALMLLAAEFPHEINLVGTTGMHAGRKAVMARQFLEQLGLATIPVTKGSGGEASSYLEINSSRAAREYQSEGRGLLPDAQLSAINSDTPRSSEALSQEIRDLLQSRDNIEIVLLAPATDLIKALEGESTLESRIRHIHVMGGWSDKPQPSGDVVRRTTYNWNMDPEAGSKLMSMTTIPMTLYSSHTIKRSFSGGSINREGHPVIIGKLESQQDRVPAFESFIVASKSWDHHLMKRIPLMKTIIGDNAGRQFTPADPAVVVGMTTHGFVTAARSVDITIDLTDLDPAKGFRVLVEDNPSSRISLVESVDPEIFRQQVIGALQKIAVK